MNYLAVQHRSRCSVTQAAIWARGIGQEAQHRIQDRWTVAVVEQAGNPSWPWCWVAQPVTGSWGPMAEARLAFDAARGGST